MQLKFILNPAACSVVEFGFNRQYWFQGIISVSLFLGGKLTRNEPVWGVTIIVFINRQCLELRRGTNCFSNRSRPLKIGIPVAKRITDIFANLNIIKLLLCGQKNLFIIVFPLDVASSVS